MIELIVSSLSGLIEDVGIPTDVVRSARTSLLPLVGSRGDLCARICRSVLECCKLLVVEEIRQSDLVVRFRLMAPSIDNGWEVVLLCRALGTILYLSTKASVLTECPNLGPEK